MIRLHPRTGVALVLAATLLSTLLAPAGCGPADDGGADGRDFVQPADIEGTIIDEEAARRLFACLKVRRTPRHRYDRRSIIALLPDTEVSHIWPEHPRRKLVLATNERGFREDGPTATEKTGVRILVTGDSHTEGFVWNYESFTTVLERRLRARADGAAGGASRYEVINAGIGAAQPYNYIGHLENHLDLRPDVFVVVVFTGNDFAGSLGVDDFLTKRARRPYPASYREALIAAIDSVGNSNERWGRTIVGNGYNQPYRFANFPEEIEVAEQAVLASLLELARICADNAIAFVTVLLPSKPEVDQGDDSALHRDLLARLGLSEDDFAVNARLGRRIQQALVARGLRCVDAAAALAARDEVLYWRKDYHLNVAGNAALAEVVEAAVVDLLPEGARRSSPR